MLPENTYRISIFRRQEQLNGRGEKKVGWNFRSRLAEMTTVQSA